MNDFLNFLQPSDWLALGVGLALGVIVVFILRSRQVWVHRRAYGYDLYTADRLRRRFVGWVVMATLIAVVGEDFPQQHITFLKSRGIDLTGLERRPGADDAPAGRGRPRRARAPRPPHGLTPRFPTRRAAGSAPAALPLSGDRLRSRGPADGFASLAA